MVEPVRVVPQFRKATSSSTRSALLANVNLKTNYEGRDEERKPAVGTTRNYSNINPDGSFTWGYEGMGNIMESWGLITKVQTNFGIFVILSGEDGSFKEETRGIDCVVRGKYG